MSRGNKTLYLDYDLLDAVKRLGEKHRHSLSIEIEEAMKEHLTKYGEPVPTTDEAPRS
jgi:hypothetical protein